MTPEKERFQLTWKGNEVGAIEPRGKWCPLFERDHYRDDNPRWRKITRFVSAGTVRW